MSNLYTYIEKSTLESWGAQMTALNNEALEILKKIETETKNLNEAWDGKAYNGFNKVMTDLINDGKKYHEDMKDIERILKEVVITAENE